VFGLNKAHLPLCLTPFVVCMFDQGITLWYQSDWYWRVHYHYAVEGNPHGRWLLQWHPLAFVAGVCAWAAVFTAAILVLPGRAAVTTALAVTIGHVWGAGTWILHRSPHGYWLCLALVTAASMLTVLGWERYHGRSRARIEVRAFGPTEPYP
jgi:hypothetical protein